MRRALVALIVGAGLAVTGCGGDDEGTAAGEPAASSGPVRVPIVLDLTGPVGFAGVEAQKGIELAVEEANAGDVLGGGRRIEVAVQDAGSDPRQAASLTTKIVGDDDVPVMMVGPGSAGTLASVPITQRAELPTVVLESNAPGIVETGNHIFRANAPQEHFTDLMAQHFENEGVKTVVQVYNNDVPANDALATETWPELAGRHGFKIVASEAAAVTASNFGSIVAKILREDPDAVMMHLSGAQHVAFVSALRRAEYDGIVGGGQGASSGTLTPLNEIADGVLFVAEYSPSTKNPNGRAFAEKYEQAEGKTPTLYASSGYDAMNFLISGLVNAGDEISRETVLAGLDKAAAAGNPDATTGPVTFEERDARIEGSLVEWRDGKDTIVEP